MAYEIKKDIVVKRRPIGIKYPLASDATSFFQLNYTTDDQIRDNVFSFFNTKIGERVMRPRYGSRIHSLVFEPTPANADSIITMLKNEFDMYLPFAKFVDAELFTDDSETNIIEINVKWTFQDEEKINETLIKL